MKTLNFRKGQRTKQRNRILVDLISKIWDSQNWKQKNWPYGWRIEIRQPYGQFFCF